MTAITLNLTADIIKTLLEQSGSEARLTIQQEVVTQVAKMMLKDYREDAEDRILTDEILDSFCEPAKDYWSKNNVTLLANFKDAIKRQVAVGIDSLIQERFAEKMNDVDKAIAAYAKSMQEVADARIEKYIGDATERHIQERVNQRLLEISGQLAKPNA
jgi:hypothetical protein